MANKVIAREIDFSNVKDMGEFAPRRVEAGDYLAQIIKVVDAPAKDETPMYVFTLKLKSFSQNSYPYYCKLVENQLWKMRNILVAGGLNVPKRRVKVDPSKLVGKWVGVTMEDDEYEDKLKSVIAAIFPASELGEGEVVGVDEDEVDETEEIEEPQVEEEEPEPEPEEEEEDTEEGDEFTNMDRLALKSFIKAKDDSFKFLRSHTDDDLRAKARELNAPAEEEEDDELEELEIDEV